MLYKHKNNTDVAFEIIKIFYVKEKKLFKLRVMWWNIVKSHKPYCMNLDQRIEIPLEKWNDWEHYTP